MFLKRSMWEGTRRPAITVVSPGDTQAAVLRALAKAARQGPLPAGDAKEICRGTIAKAGDAQPPARCLPNSRSSSFWAASLLPHGATICGLPSTLRSGVHAAFRNRTAAISWGTKAFLEDRRTSPSLGDPLVLSGRFVNLFDPDLQLNTRITLSPASRYFLLDISGTAGSQPKLLAAACKTFVNENGPASVSLTVEGVEGTPAVVLFYSPRGAPRTITLAGKPLESTKFSAADHLLWVHFANESSPRELRILF